MEGFRNAPESTVPRVRAPTVTNATSPRRSTHFTSTEPEPMATTTTTTATSPGTPLRRSGMVESAILRLVSRMGGPPQGESVGVSNGAGANDAPGIAPLPPVKKEPAVKINTAMQTDASFLMDHRAAVTSARQRVMKEMTATETVGRYAAYYELQTQGGRPALTQKYWELFSLFVRVEEAFQIFLSTASDPVPLSLLQNIEHDLTTFTLAQLVTILPRAYRLSMVVFRGRREIGLSGGSAGVLQEVAGFPTSDTHSRGKRFFYSKKQQMDRTMLFHQNLVAIIRARHEIFLHSIGVSMTPTLEIIWHRDFPQNTLPNIKPTTYVLRMSEEVDEIEWPAKRRPLARMA